MLVKATFFLLIVHEKDPSNLGDQHIYYIYIYKGRKFSTTNGFTVQSSYAISYETMNYILCGGLPEYPLQQCEKSWINVNQDDYNIRDYHMLSHNKSTNILIHIIHNVHYEYVRFVLTFQKLKKRSCTHTNSRRNRTHFPNRFSG